MSWNHGVRCDHSRSAETAAGRLPFLRLLARLVSNPVASWGRISTTSRSWSTATLASRRYSSPILSWPSKFCWTTATPSPRAHSTTMSSAAPAVGLLIAEGDDWRWQRRIAAPLFRAEAILSYACLCRCLRAGAGQLAQSRAGLASNHRQRYDRCGHAGAAGHQVTMLH